MRFSKQTPDDKLTNIGMPTESNFYRFLGNFLDTFRPILPVFLTCGKDFGILIIVDRKSCTPPHFFRNTTPPSNLHLHDVVEGRHSGSDWGGKWSVRGERRRGSSRVTFNEAADPGNRQTIQVAPQTPKIILKEWTIGGSWKGLSLRVWGAEQVLVFSGVGWRGLGRASQIL